MLTSWFLQHRPDGAEEPGVEGTRAHFGPGLAFSRPLHPQLHPLHLGK